jgi:hypothetical protein
MAFCFRFTTSELSLVSLECEARQCHAQPIIYHEHGDKGRQGVNEFLDNFTSGSRE